MINPRFFDTPKLFPKPVMGRVEVEISPQSPGRVAFNGSVYPAKLYSGETEVTLEPGDFCQVVGRESITLLVII